MNSESASLPATFTQSSAGESTPSEASESATSCRYTLKDTVTSSSHAQATTAVVTEDRNAPGTGVLGSSRLHKSVVGLVMGQT
jgi:hypothetical protein